MRTGWDSRRLSADLKPDHQRADTLSRIESKTRSIRSCPRSIVESDAPSNPNRSAAGIRSFWELSSWSDDNAKRHEVNVHGAGMIISPFQ